MLKRCYTKKNGILGFGIVGKSYLKFLANLDKNLKISIWDQRILNDSELKLINNFGATVADIKNISIKEFIDNHDYVFVSPGFNLTGIDCCKDKFICELDLFFEYSKNRSIAITGTLGKTTITNLLDQILNKVYQKSSCIGGNIGVPMLELIKRQKDVDTVVLELSSFQLDLNKKFAPDIAIWTNFYPNHLDWHKCMKEYFDAKSKVFEYQTKNQSLLVPASFLKETLFLDKLKNIKSQVYFVAEENEQDLIKDFLKLKEKFNNIFFASANNCFFANPAHSECRATRGVSKGFLDITFKKNWFFILTVLDILGLDTKLLKKYFEDKNSLSLKNNLQDHRLEHFVAINNIDFYNDSKATVIQATLNAVQKLNQKNKPIILILGGTSKGVNRNSLLKDLHDLENLKKIFCLSKNNNEFSGIKTYSSLQELLSAIMQIAKPGDQVLFSPSGASFDFFDNYKHRGEIFKKLVFDLAD